MLTREQLSAMLLEVNAEDLAKEARVSLKTIYRLRHGVNSPKLDTVAALVDAVHKLKARAARAQRLAA